MPDSATELGADLYRLDRMAHTNLRDVAAEYAMAAAEVGATDSGLAAAFTRDEQFGGTYGPVYQPWCDLRDRIRRFLSDTSTNLIDTAHALLLAVHAYAATDAAAAAELNRLKSQNGLG